MSVFRICTDHVCWGTQVLLCSCLDTCLHDALPAYTSELFWSQIRTCCHRSSTSAKLPQHCVNTIALTCLSVNTADIVDICLQEDHKVMCTDQRHCSISVCFVQVSAVRSLLVHLRSDVASWFYVLPLLLSLYWHCQPHAESTQADPVRLVQEERNGKMACLEASLPWPWACSVQGSWLSPSIL